MSIFLGVDGGGTKTALCLVTSEGELAASTLAPSCYYLSVGGTAGVGLVERVLREGVDAVCRQAGIVPEQVQRAFFGLPAYGEVSADLPALDAAPRAALHHDRYDCDNDMVAGWAGSLGAVDGINVVSGTGSICYGERDGIRVRVGGWGELFGDEGSGHWIGVRGLQAFSCMSDGRLPPGPLLEALRSHLGLHSDLDLVDVVLNRWRGDRQRVAALSRVVVEAASRGDGEAAAVLAEAAGALVALVEAARRRLGFPDGEPVPVSHSGGVFTAPQVRQGFARRLADAHPGYQLREPLHLPVVGAALYAAKRAGAPLAPAALERLRRGGGGAPAAAAGPDGPAADLGTALP